MKDVIKSKICPICDAKGHVAIYGGPYQARYNRILVRLDDVERFRCEACKEEFFDRDQSRRLSRQVKLAARESMGLLGPERIAALRGKLRLSQEAMEELLGLGPKVVTRWESGRVVQGKATDNLLRLMERMPEIVVALRAIQGERSRKGSTRESDS